MNEMAFLRREIDVASSLLALRFWDQALELPVTDGLIVTARPAARAGPVTRATRAGACWHSFHQLPGIPARQAVPEASQPFIIEVADSLERFMPLAFPVSLPYPGTGAFRCPERARRRPDDQWWVPLCSGRARRPPTQAATITGQLVQKETERPAAYAVLRAEAASGSFYGIADAEGCLTLLFPYPALPVGARRLQWPVKLQVLAGGRPQDLAPYGSVDPFAACSQADGLLLPDSGGGPQAVHTATIRFGEVFILRSDSASALRVEVTV
ncbi:MAG: hypothetical protein K0R39_1676 [Symbiobacteriaceae bacterium]|jgi:hypothetical protein|nr:hypothetical protein [Symbiobacteriaceae bacterium]